MRRYLARGFAAITQAEDVRNSPCHHERARPFSDASVQSAVAEKSSRWRDFMVLSLTLPGNPGFTRPGLWGALSEEQFWRAGA